MALIMTIHQNDGPLTADEIGAFIDQARRFGLPGSTKVLADLNISNEICYLKVEGEGA